LAFLLLLAAREPEVAGVSTGAGFHGVAVFHAVAGLSLQSACSALICGMQIEKFKYRLLDIGMIFSPAIRFSEYRNYGTG
jgi:hypothetical protein